MYLSQTFALKKTLALKLNQNLNFDEIGFDDICKIGVNSDSTFIWSHINFHQFTKEAIKCRLRLHYSIILKIKDTTNPLFENFIEEILKTIDIEELNTIKNNFDNWAAETIPACGTGGVTTPIMVTDEVKKTTYAEIVQKSLNK